MCKVVEAVFPSRRGEKRTFSVCGQEGLVLKKKKSIKSSSMNELEWAMLHGLP